jgi:hypothetical protein
MNDPERFNDLVETLLADRSPAAQARDLNLEGQRMLLLAQRLRGSQGQGPDPIFVEAPYPLLRRRLSALAASAGDSELKGR